MTEPKRFGSLVKLSSDLVNAQATLTEPAVVLMGEQAAGAAREARCSRR
jgi:hypothetical protein